MAFNIKDEQVVEEVRRLAARTGESMTEAIARSVRERTERLGDERAARRARVMRLIEQGREILGDEPLPDHGELLYDPETGLPR